MEINFNIDEICKIVTNVGLLIRGSVEQDGFVFKGITQANIYDALVIYNPMDAYCLSPRIPHGTRTLEECINLINTYQLDKAIIIGEDISFVTECPSLRYLAIHPSSEFKNGFDYSPLYKMPELHFLQCDTEYGEREAYTTSIDYSKIHGLKELYVVGKGHLNYQKIDTLEFLNISNQKLSDFQTFDLPKLKKLSIVQSSVQTLQGIENCPKLQWLGMSYMRNLSDISALVAVAPTLRSFCIESSPKITDFSVLSGLKKLEYLTLEGKNELPNLDFIKELPKLKFLRLTMNVQDGNLEYLQNLQYVNAVCKRHYNLKNKDLPKDDKDLGFYFI